MPIVGHTPPPPLPHLPSQQWTGCELHLVKLADDEVVISGTDCTLAVVALLSGLALASRCSLVGWEYIHCGYPHIYSPLAFYGSCSKSPLYWWTFLSAVSRISVLAVHKPPRYRIAHRKIKPSTGSYVISDLAVIWDMISYQKHNGDNKVISIRKLFVFVGENKWLFSNLFYFPFYQLIVFFYWNWIALHFTVVLFLNLGNVFILFLYCYVSNTLRSTEWNVMECTMTIKSSIKQPKQMERTNTILHNSEAQGFMLLHSSLVCTAMLSLLINRR